jgi:fermentation-respiration switch protein FrsA (DUF1100 family)
MTWLLAAAGLALSAWLAAAAYLFLMQRWIMYPAAREAPSPLLVPGRAPRVVETRAADGVACRHWYWPAQRGQATVALFHGNAGHLGDRVAKYWPLAQAGHGLLLCGYRGYGGNPGQPTEAGLLADARAALDWLAAQGVPAPVLHGESLGTAVAVALAAEGRGGALVLEAPFDRAASVGAAIYWWLPVRRLIRDRWDSLARIGRVRQPLLWLHGTDDAITPLALGQRLYDAAPGPKRAVIVEGGGHVEFLERAEVVAELLAFIEAAPRRTADEA